jgi:hypothetical protein
LALSFQSFPLLSFTFLALPFLTLTLLALPLLSFLRLPGGSRGRGGDWLPALSLLPFAFQPLRLHSFLFQPLLQLLLLLRRIISARPLGCDRCRQHQRSKHNSANKSAHLSPKAYIFSKYNLFHI